MERRKKRENREEETIKKCIGYLNLHKGPTLSTTNPMLQMKKPMLSKITLPAKDLSRFQQCLTLEPLCPAPYHRPILSPQHHAASNAIYN